MSLPVSAKAIGELYDAAHNSHRISVDYLLKAGAQLAAIRDSLPHGEWQIWCHENKEALGFCDRTARRLIQAHREFSKRTSTSDLEPTQALAISRKVWNNFPTISETDDTRTAAFKQIMRLFEWMTRHPPQDIAQELFYAETAEVRDRIAIGLEWLAWLEKHTRSNGKTRQIGTEAHANGG